MGWLTFKKPKQVPQSYKPELTPKEVVDLYGRLTMHHQTALLRLMSRNMAVQIGDQVIMGYEFDYDVDGAVIRMYPSEEWAEEPKPETQESD